ncbi:hypothetical protein CDD80_3225 [Ophiocordyceps camponoti-rufipedis]|uniref:DNA-directed RNA polymerase III subunit RPC3 n=1 Tax=Ophiocordyceps camponoti-rufipedis TaxID=2004952 RepID=A0A2C5Z4C0_9HYPO|nr:hypothetical protein CDD80_3225 [Ophiocordyceps camponoti-rufipedis]
MLQPQRELVQTLMLLGYARVADLGQAFDSRGPSTNGHTNGTQGSVSGLISSEHHMQQVLSRLIQQEIVETVHPDSFRNPADIYREIENEVTKTAPGDKVSKNKIEQHMQIVERFKEFRDQSKALKRRLDHTYGSTAKRRKTENGSALVELTSWDDAPPINPNVVVRVNRQKCLVLSRNQRLADFASESFGEVTGQVYRTLLELLTKKLAVCRADPFIGDQASGQQPTATSIEIYESIDEAVNLQSGIGKAPKDTIDVRSAEKIRPTPLAYDSDSDASDEESGVRGPRTVGRDEAESEDDFGPRKARSTMRVNGERQATVKFEDESKDSRLDQMRQHLLLLAESKHRFVRYCGTAGRGQWTVDFGQLMERLRESELDAYIEQSFGRHGLRLTRILRDKGKLDEKMLPSTALMKKSDVQGKMLAMQMAGLVEVQEVPKDNSRLANRTLFFWFFDGERTQSQLLDDVYKAMLRCLQTLQVERHKERNILLFVERKDVKGKEEEVMLAEHYLKYRRHLEQQEKLISQVARLDDMVAVLRDY